jgi:hypothetical protein
MPDDEQSATERLRQLAQDYSDTIETRDTEPFGESRLLGSNDDSNFTVSFEVDTTDFEYSAPSFTELSARTYSKKDKIFTGKNILMDNPEIETWILEQAFDEFTTDEMESLIDDGGYPAVRHELMARRSEEITEYSETENLIAAFNHVSMEWPYQARAYLAAYEAQHADRGEPQYTDQCEEFAQAEDVMDYQTRLDTDWWCGENPYQAENLTEKQAEAALLLHADEEDPSIVEDVEHAESFIKWYKRLGDAEQARRSCRFDGDIQPEVAGVLAGPDEWPDEMNPQNIHETSCLRCSIPLFDVYHNTHERLWVDHTGTAHGNAIDTGDDNEYHAQGSDGVLCNGCADMTRSETVILYVDNTSYRAEISGDDSVYRDIGSLDGNISEPLDTLDDSLEDQFFTLLFSHNGETSDLFSVSPTGQAPSPIGAQEQLLSDIVDRTCLPDIDGPIYIHDDASAGAPRLLMPRTNPTAAREGKELLENADDLISA